MGARACSLARSGGRPVPHPQLTQTTSGEAHSPATFPPQLRAAFSRRAREGVAAPAAAPTRRSLAPSRDPHRPPPPPPPTARLAPGTPAPFTPH
eukprot:scaffold14643_cov113-Isochrysis_galbana.AAC.4